MLLWQAENMLYPSGLLARAISALLRRTTSRPVLALARGLENAFATRALRGLLPLSWHRSFWRRGIDDLPIQAKVNTHRLTNLGGSPLHETTEERTMSRKTRRGLDAGLRTKAGMERASHHN